MAETPVQNFSNHVRTPTPLILAMLLLLCALVMGIVSIFTTQALLHAAVALVAASGIVVAIQARTYATLLQDRIIRLEMRLRLATVLEGELAARIGEFSRSQLIGLRFASDAEMNGLAQKVLDENITKATDIKKLVTDWQADHLRV